MPSKKQVIKVYVSPEEYGEIHQNARKAGLSLSTFAKRVCLSSTVYSRVEAPAVLALIRTNADLAQLGNLIKAVLNLQNGQVHRINKLLLSIDTVRNDIRTKIFDIRS